PASTLALYTFPRFPHRASGKPDQTVFALAAPGSPHPYHSKQIPWNPAADDAPARSPDHQKGPYPKPSPHTPGNALQQSYPAFPFPSETNGNDCPDSNGHSPFPSEAHAPGCAIPLPPAANPYHSPAGEHC